MVIQRETLGSQGYALVQFDIVAYNAGCAYHDSGPMVYREMMSDSGCRMDVYTGFRMWRPLLRQSTPNCGTSPTI